MIRVDSRSTRKTAHIIVAENVPFPYGTRTGSKAKCGMMLWSGNLRPREEGEPMCVRCNKADKKTSHTCPTCNGSGIVEAVVVA